MAASDGVCRGPAGKQGTDTSTVDDSSESDGETEPAKSFHRKISTNKNIKCSVCTKEGYLNKQTSSFQRWRRRYFKLKGRTFYYAKDTKSVVFDEIQLTELSVAECSIKNANHSFQVITPFRSLVLCAETRREMEEWIAALRAAAHKEYYESGETHDFLSGQHNWYATSHARPTYCNVCREALSGVTSHGLSCEVCKFKAHKRCAVKALNNCKWTTLASVGKDILEDEDGNLATPHQWVEGNLPVSAKCLVCDKTCGSVLRLQDWRCLWCRACVHTACRPASSLRCPLGPCRVSIVPPTALHSVGSDEAWEAIRPQGTSPLLVFVNSKSGDNQGVKFLRRFKQLLNPAQVFDLMNGGPGLGLRLFRHFDPFRILICSGDGSIGWVLSEIDKLQMQKQCQVGVLPLGTGNDLARVLGWGSVCDDDAHLPQLLHRYEKASVKMLDRWAILIAERTVSLPLALSLPQSLPLPLQPIADFEDSVLTHLTRMLQSDQHAVVIASAKVLCETVKDFIAKLSGLEWDGDDAFARKVGVLHEKLDLLLHTLHAEDTAAADTDDEAEAEEEIPVFTSPEETELEEEDSASSDPIFRHKGMEEETEEAHDSPDNQTGRMPKSFGKQDKQKVFIPRDALMSRAESLKKAVRQIMEQADRLLDEQTAETGRDSSAHSTPIRIKLVSKTPPTVPPMSKLSVPTYPVTEFVTANELSPSPSPLPPPLPSLTTNFPFLPAVSFSSSPPSPQPARPRPRPQLTYPENLESEGEEDQEALLSLQAQLQALSPLPDSESFVSTEFDLSGLALPVPLEFADTDSLTNNCIPRAEKEYDEEDSLAATTPLPQDLGPVTIYDAADEEPNQVEEKPIPQLATPLIALLIESPSPENSASQHTIVQDDDEDPKPWAALGERIVEGAEATPIIRVSRAHTQSASPYRGPATPMHARLALPMSTLLPASASSRRSSLEPSPTASRRISTGSVLLLPTGGGGVAPSSGSASPALGLSAGAMLAPPPLHGNPRSPEPRREKEKKEEDEIWAARKRKLPIINPLVALPMWPNVEGACTGGLIRQALLANADALCAAASPLMDLESDDAIDELYDEKCVMNSYFGIGIDAKITLDFHMKREEHPEKCRSRARNYMWYGVLGSKEWLQKTYKNLEQRVLLECDGTRIPLPSLQGIVVLNIPSFMGGTNFWGGTKDDDIFRAPSFDDRILEVVAVFGSVQMAASRIINLQHHRIAQCNSVKITVLGEEGVPVQVDGEAWLQPPGIIRLRHKNRMQMLSRNRALERSLETWQEKQQRPVVTGSSTSKGGMISAEEESLVVGAFVEAATSLVRCVRLMSISVPGLGDMEADLCTLASHASSILDKMHPTGKLSDLTSLRSQWMDLMHTMRQLQQEAHLFARDRISLYHIRREQEEKLGLSVSQVESEMRRMQDTTFLAAPEEIVDKKGLRGVQKSGMLSKLKFRKTSGPLGRAFGKAYDWNADEVGTWLDTLSLSEYRDAFCRHDIRGAELLSLERRDLKELGVTKIGHIKRLQQGIRDLKQQQQQQ